MSLPAADPAVDRSTQTRRELALQLALRGVAAADPGAATARLVAGDPDGVEIAGHRYALERDARVVVLGAGKATWPIAAALRDALGARLHGGVIAVREGEARALDPIEVIAADHPLPTRRSTLAGEALLNSAAELRPGDLAICCFTGGSSALASVPVPAITAVEKRDLHDLLLRSGIPIDDINGVRKHVSAVKGGRLAALTAATVVNLTVSDVVGDRLDTITDPTVPDTTTPAGAVALLKRHRLWDQVAPSVRSHLQAGVAPPSLEDREIETVLLANGRTACEAMAREAAELGWRAVTVSTELTGESREAGRFLAGLAAHCCRHATPWQPPVVLLGCGGETTVTLGDSDTPFGAGGPNQEMALAAAAQLAQLPVAALFIDTDSSDGGSELAGGLVDGTSAARAAENGVDLDEALRRHRSSRALEELGDAIRLQPSGTNVNDLFVLVIDQPEEP